MADPLTPQQQDAVEHASLLVAGREVLVHAEDEYEYGDEYDLAEVPTRRVPQGTIYEAARVGDVERIQQLLEEGGANVNQRDRWDSVPLYYSCLAGHMDAARALLEAGAICNEHTFDGDRCHYAALNLRIRRLLKQYEMRPPPMAPLQRAFKDAFELVQSTVRTPAHDSLATSLTMLGINSNSSSNSSYASSANNSSSSSSSNDSRRDSAISVHQGRSSSPTTSGGGSAAEAQEVSLHPALEPDVVFILDSDSAKPRIAAHRAILAARSEYFRRAFAGRWRHKREVYLANPKLTFAALHSLLAFFYSDRFDIDSDELPALARTCRNAGCTPGLIEGVERECFHLRHARSKMPLMSMDELGKARPRRGMHVQRLNEDGELEDTPTPSPSIPKRCILQAASLPEPDRLPAAMHQLRSWCLASSYDPPGHTPSELEEPLQPPRGEGSAAIQGATPGCAPGRPDTGEEAGREGQGQGEAGVQDDFADVCLLSRRGRHFRCHRMVLAARSDYFKVLFTHSLPTQQMPYHLPLGTSPSPPQDTRPSPTLGAGSRRGSNGTAAAASTSVDPSCSCSCSVPLDDQRAPVPVCTGRGDAEGCNSREDSDSDSHSGTHRDGSDKARGEGEHEGGGRGTVEPGLGAGASSAPCQCCRDEKEGRGLPHIPIHEVEDTALELMLEYMYTDRIECMAPGEAAGLLDAACRFLLFPLKRAVADALLPHLQEAAAPPDLCDWLLLADFYGVWKLREYCLDVMAANFDELSANRQFRQMLRRLPPPSGDSSLRTTAPAVPGREVGLPAVGLPAPLAGAAPRGEGCGEGGEGEGGGLSGGGGGGDGEGANVLDDLREKWLEMEGAELEERDVSAAQFDARLMELAAWELDLVEEEQGGAEGEGQD